MYYGPGTAEFNSLEACNAAAVAITQQQRVIKASIVAFCVSKGVNRNGYTHK